MLFVLLFYLEKANNPNWLRNILTSGSYDIIHGFSYSFFLFSLLFIPIFQPILLCYRIDQPNQCQKKNNLDIRLIFFKLTENPLFSSSITVSIFFLFSFHSVSFYPVYFPIVDGLIWINGVWVSDDIRRRSMIYIML